MKALYKSLTWAFKTTLKTFFPIVGLAFFFGNFHAGLGGYFSLVASYILSPFHFLASVFNYSGSSLFWVSSIILEFLAINSIYFVIKFLYEINKRK